LKYSTIKYFVVFLFITSYNYVSAQIGDGYINIELTENGSIPIWLVNGPFEQGTTGFGIPSDTDNIDEQNNEPYFGKIEVSDIVAGNEAKWILQSINENNFLDLNSTLDWRYPGAIVEKEWMAKAGYAFTYIYSEEGQKVKLLFGSNSSAKIILNGEQLYKSENTRNALADQDTIVLSLNSGLNKLLVKTGNSHQNYTISFFTVIKYEWGFYNRLIDEYGNVPEGVTLFLPDRDVKFQSRVESTFYFKDIDSKLHQRFDLFLNSPYTDIYNGEIKLTSENINESFRLSKIRTGLNRFELYLPAIDTETQINAQINIYGDTFETKYILHPQEKYELHMMLLTHMDIGYTNIQPVVIERHLNVIDDVIEMCENDEKFKWTLETTWMLQQYELARPHEIFVKLIDLIKSGRIAVSPIYTNPFTGWIGKEEMIRSFDLAKYYAKKYNLKYYGAVYDDVPGESFMLPSVLKDIGVGFLANGFNEIYTDYTLQRNLPKAFIWEGSDSSKVISYRNETYVEGKSFGLTHDNYVIEHRLWSRLNKLIATRNDFNPILMNTAFTDNAGIAQGQYQAALKWNEEYAYPKFVISNLSEFAKVFIAKYKDGLEIIRGDLTSPWDINYQGEAKLFKKYRWAQHNILSAEKLSSLNTLLNKKNVSFTNEIDNVYESMLNFSAHGSGLEFGYGSPEDNRLAVEYREDYVQSAYLGTKGLLEKGIYRLTKSEESFEGPGIVVFNPLSWYHDQAIKVNFPKEGNLNYSIKDLATNTTLPSAWSGHSLIFIADSLPSFGYKKYRLFDAASAETKPSDFVTGLDLSIENEYYKIEIDKRSQNIKSILSKTNSKDIIDHSNKLGFNIPLVEKFQIGDNFSSIDSVQSDYLINHNTPVYEELLLTRKNHLFEETKYTLYKKINRIDISQKLNLSTLSQTSTIEEYAVALPVNINPANYKVEILGGFADPSKDIMRGNQSDAFSIRRVVAIYNDMESFYIALKDSRVVKFIRSEDGHKTLLISIYNNFPESWNRNEINEGYFDISYSIMHDDNTIDYSLANRFGWEVNTEPVIRNSWFKSEPTSESYLSIDNPNIMLLTVKNTHDSYQLQLLNVNPVYEESCTIKSDLFIKNMYTVSSDIVNKKQYNNEIFVSLKPNELRSIIFKNPK
jgi:Glycosyl hydrolases family 38 N-terminal domain